MSTFSQFDDSALKDPSWKRARSICEKSMPVHSNLSRLLRGAWLGSFDLEEMFRVLSFAGAHPTAVLAAAEVYPLQEPATAELLESSVKKIGLRMSAVVLGINYVTTTMLRSAPPPHWKTLLQETMAAIEVGQIFGTKVSAIGSEIGMLLGFARYAGRIALLTHNREFYKSCFIAVKGDDPQLQIDRFGCEAYQVSALLMQELGFGPDLAMAMLLAMGRLNASHLTITPEVSALKAAYLWVDSLFLGRNYPADPQVRVVFPEIAPPRESSNRNPQLEALYAEIARVRSKGSTWMWHLPKNSYEATAEWLTLQARSNEKK